MDRTPRLMTVRHSIIWQRVPAAISCLLLLALLVGDKSRLITLGFFAASVALACLEKLAFVANTVSVERDWIIVIADSLSMDRQELNSAMRRIDLVCKLIAPLCISVVDGYSTRIAIWVVFGQNALSVVFEYFAIAQVFYAVPQLGEHTTGTPVTMPSSSQADRTEPSRRRNFPSNHGLIAWTRIYLAPWQSYISNPAFLASFSLSLLYLTVLSFASQMTTYLLSVGFKSIHVSLMRLVAVTLELVATCAAPVLMRRIGAVRSGLWFINEQLLSIAIFIGLYTFLGTETRLAAAALVTGVIISRTGLWGFDLCVQYLVQEDAPEDSRGSFSATEAAVQNFFELISFGVTMIFHRPEEFRIPVYISAGTLAVSAACFAAFVRQKRGHLLHTSRCFRREGKRMYEVLPTIEEEEMEELAGAGMSSGTHS